MHESVICDIWVYTIISVIFQTRLSIIYSRCLSRQSSVPGLGGLKKNKKKFLSRPRVKVSIVWSLRDREVAFSASDRQGSNFASCVWRTALSQSSHHPLEVLLTQFSLYVHKGGLKPNSSIMIWTLICLIVQMVSLHWIQVKNMIMIIASEYSSHTQLLLHC